MATTSERTDENVNRKKGEEEEETKNLPSSSSTDGAQGDQTTAKTDDLNDIGKTDTLSAMQSTNEDKKSDQTSSTSDIQIEKINEEQSVETTTNKDDDDSKPDQLVTSSTHSDDIDKHDDKKTDKDNAFLIEKGDEQHLTDFQRRKAKYFFNVNLDIENKEYVTWEDVEFYLLFHLTAAGKEGSDGGDLEARLSRTARAFWEHVHDQIPLSDGKRDQLTLNQFLDTWASLIDYVVRTNQLPSIVQDLVRLGYELYSTEGDDGKTVGIQLQAFDQLFQKMNLSRPFAIMAYKYLTDNGSKQLDAEKIDSLVKAVITSSDDEHESHFLLPGFFKTILGKKNDEKEEKPSSPIKNEEQAKTSGQPSPTSKSPPTTPQVQQSNILSSNSPPPSQEQPKSTSSSSSPPPPPPPPSAQRQSSTTSSANQQQNAPLPSSISQTGIIQREDEGIRRLLRYYHIDDGDIVEVAGGSPPRLVLVHPERPLPPYIQQDKQLLQKLQPDATQNGWNKGQNAAPETKPKVALVERVSRGEAQKGPTVPLRQEQQQENASSTGVRQVYPQLSAAQQEEQRRQAKLQATQPAKVEKPPTDDTSAANPVSLSSKQDETKQTKEINRDEEEKIVAAVLKQLEPIVEKRVAAQLRRLQSADTDEDEDEQIIPFPFVLGGGFPFFAAPRGGPPPQRSREQQNAPNQRQQQQQGNGQRVDFGGLPAGAEMFPPQFLMAMMNDLAQGGMGGEIPPNMARPPHGPIGVEGFMMFVDDDQFMGGPPRPGPRF